MYKSIVFLSILASSVFSEDSNTFYKDQPINAEILCKPTKQRNLFDCGGPNDLLEIENVSVEPSNPKRGGKVEFKFKGNLKQDVKKVTSQLKLTYEDVGSLNFDRDYCTKKRKDGLIRCPAYKGNFNDTQTMDIPKFVPEGAYQFNIKLFAEDKLPIINIVANFNL